VSTGSLRARVTLVTLGVLVVALAGFAVTVTLRYRDGLERGIRANLSAGGQALEVAGASQIKTLVPSLSLEGINAQFSGPPPATQKPGAPVKRPPVKPPSIVADGGLLVLREPLGDPAFTTAMLTASSASVTGPVHRLIVIEIVGGVAILVVAGALLLWGLRAALEPLAVVGRVASSIAAGDRRRRLRPRRPDTELGRMAAAFDEMVDALETTAEQAQRSESAMRRFLGDASHELRTPVAALQATAETLLREQPARPARDGLEAHLARDTARLGQLVDDLLNLARLEASEPLRHERVDLAATAQREAAQARQRCPAATVTLHVAEPAAGVAVLGDGEALARALRNLLDNALAATRGAGHIGVDLTREGDLVVIRVSDDGPGVASSERERIFDGFVRLPGTAGTGVGLGLAIVRRIAAQHGGEACCEDHSPGARFALRLPAIPSTPAPPASAASSSTTFTPTI
jgi:two-component system OmpR family sensor kinase